jgi:hypothetical protein
VVIPTAVAAATMDVVSNVTNAAARYPVDELKQKATG